MIDPRFYELTAALHRGGAFAHYWTPDGSDGLKYSYWYGINGHQVEPPDGWDAKNLYFTVHPAGPNASRNVHRKTHKIDISAVNCLYAEFDAKDWPDNSALLTHITSLNPLPSVVISSGGGYHCYWLLKDTFTITGPEEHTRIDQIETAWVQLVQGDQTVHDLARVLRVPGTLNHKYSPPRPVTIVHWQPQRLFILDDLVKRLTDAGCWPPRATTQPGAAPAGSVGLDDGKLLELARKADNGARFERLWQGDTTVTNGDHSAADLALCTMLAFWTRRDAYRIDRLFRQSGLFRTKWDRDEYRDRTIQKACDSVYSVYEPSQTDDEAVQAAQAALGIHVARRVMTPSQPAMQTALGSAPTSIEQTIADFDPNDEGNALAARYLFGLDFFYCEAYGWLYWAGTHWQMEGAEDALREAITGGLKARQIAAMKLGKDPIVRASKPNWSTVRACIEMFRPKVSIDVKEFDADPDLLNVRNGVLNLRTGVLEEHSRQRFTYCCPVDYDPGADYVEWVEFLASVVNDPEVIEYLQTAAGYSITGHTREEVLFYLHGPTRSGKGTFSESLLSILGYPLGIEADFATFTAERKGDTQNFDLAPLKPARLIVASESNKYETLNEAKVKAVTGGNWVRCAFKHHDHFEYRPQFKIWLTSNHPVKGDVDDDAFWGRVRVIEFPNSFLGKEDKGLKERFKSREAQRGILRWIVEGAHTWYASQRGLETPAGVVNTTAARRQDLDYMAQWLSDCCKVDPADQTLWSRSVDLYQSYKDWCYANGVVPKQTEQWGRGLAAKKLLKQRRRLNSKITPGFVGVAII